MFNEHRDFIYTMTVAGGLCLSGGGDGMVLAHDLKQAQGSQGLLWGLGASSQGAVRAIGITARHLVAAADDGNVLVYRSR